MKNLESENNLKTKPNIPVQKKISSLRKAGTTRLFFAEHVTLCKLRYSLFDEQLPLLTLGAGLLQTHGFLLKHTLNESMVSFVSRRYMRVINGSLVVCLSDYLPLRSHSVYILVIKVLIALLDFHR